MPRYEVVLESIALYQQGRRTAERVKTLRREIDDISRELHERLDDLDMIIEENWPHLLSKLPPRTTDVARKPEPSTWTIYTLAAKRVWIGEIEARDERKAIEKAAIEFKLPAMKLTAERRR